MTTRRNFVVLSAAALGAPLAAFAQPQGKIWRVGFLTVRRIQAHDPGYHDGFARGLRDLGYIEDRNLAIEWRSADGDYERLPGLAAELVQKNVHCLVAIGTLAARAAQKATSTIPIVMSSVNDPVADGFVASLARPEGNITGVTNLAADIGSKHLEMLLNIAPRLVRVAVLLTPANSSHAVTLDTVRAAGRQRGIQVVGAEARTRPDIDKALATILSERAQGFIVAQDGFLIQNAANIAALAIKHWLPSIAAFSEYPNAGGLLSYGQNLVATHRRAAVFVDRILKGARPADLPVEQATTLELVINGRTAKALGVTIPQALLISADRVIE